MLDATVSTAKSGCATLAGPLRPKGRRYDAEGSASVAGEISEILQNFSVIYHTEQFEFKF